MTSAAQKITVGVPPEILENAMKVTRMGITATIIEGLRELERKGKRSALQKLKGRVKIEIDLDETRR